MSGFLATGPRLFLTAGRCARSPVTRSAGAWRSLRGVLLLFLATFRDCMLREDGDLREETCVSIDER